MGESVRTELTTHSAEQEAYATICDGLCTIVEVIVKRRIVFSVLLASLSLLIGCYSTAMISKDEFNARAEQVDIIVVTKDSFEYTFLKENYRIRGDTLSGSGKRTRNSSTEIVLDARLPFDAITSIENQEFDLTRTAGLCAGAGLGGLIIYTLLFGR